MSRTSNRGDWRAAALCAQTDPDAFFPEPSRSAAPALKVCGSCDVRGDCLDFALEHGESGVWGGTTDEQRRGMRRSTR